MDCPHEKIRKIPDGFSYCIDCGETIELCCHKNYFQDQNTGLHICFDCGEEFEILDYEPEWRSYNRGNNGRTNHPKIKGGSIKSIDDVFEKNNLTISDNIKSIIEERYNRIISEETKKTIRGDKRTAVVANCLYFVYQELGEYRTTDYIKKLFGNLEDKKMTYGYQVYTSVFPESSSMYVEPINLLKWLMTLTGVGEEHYEEIAGIISDVRQTSSNLIRSTPQSVASAAIFYYISSYPKNQEKKYKDQMKLSKEKFAKKALLSEITVSKLMKIFSSYYED